MSDKHTTDPKDTEIGRLKKLLRDLQEFSMMDQRLHNQDELIRREQELGDRIAEALK